MKRLIAIAVAFLMLLSLCGCTEATGLQEESSEFVNSSETPEEDGSGNEQEQLDSGKNVLSRSTISETWDSGVVVDANVTAIDRERLASYTGVFRVFTVDEVTEALGLSSENAVESQTFDSLEGYVPGKGTYLKYEHNCELICNMAQISYASETFFKVRDLLITSGSGKNANQFLTGENLDFATIEQAEAEIQEILEKLEIPVVNEPLCYTMDYKSLSTENERQYKLAVELAEGFDQAFSPEKLDIIKDDACYMFYYPVAVDGMPVSPYPNGVYGDGSLIAGTELIVCYNKDGVAGLSLEYQPEVKEKTEAQPVLSLDEILQKEKAKYDSLILDGEYLIYDIRLEYIAQPIYGKDNTYNIIPVWRFAVEHSFELPKGDESDASLQATEITYDVFNAVTGEELPLDIG